MKPKALLVCLVLLLFILSACSKRESLSLPKPIDMPEEESVSDIHSLLAQSYSDTELFKANATIYDSDGVHYEIYTPLFEDEGLNERVRIISDGVMQIKDSPLVRLNYLYSQSHGIESFLFITELYRENELERLYSSLNFESVGYSPLTLADCLEDDELSELLSGVDRTVAAFYISPIESTVYSHGDKIILPSGSLKLLDDRKRAALCEYSPVTDLSEKVVALTFDDGPSALTTPWLCDMLFEKGVKATFFVLGLNLDGNPQNKATLKRLYENGNEIGIHSYNHPNFNTMSFAQITKQIEDTQALIVSATGEGSRLVRPPYGNMSKNISKQLDYFIIRWSVDPEDWKDKTDLEIANAVIDNTSSGDIILLHDIHSRSCRAAEIVIDTLINEGYRFVTISELYDLHNTTPDGRLYFNIEDS